MVNPPLSLHPSHPLLLVVSYDERDNSQNTGFQKVYPAVATIPEGPLHLVGKRAAADSWSYVNQSLLVVGTFMSLAI